MLMPFTLMFTPFVLTPFVLAGFLPFVFFMPLARLLAAFPPFVPAAIFMMAPPPFPVVVISVAFMPRVAVVIVLGKRGDRGTHAESQNCSQAHPHQLHLLLLQGTE
jgi:hypothetical protein